MRHDKSRTNPCPLITNQLYFVSIRSAKSGGVMIKSIILVVVLVVLLAAGIVIVKYNGIIDRQVAVEKAWAPLLIKLRERYTPVPRMIVEVTTYSGKKPDQAKDLEAELNKVDSIKSLSDAVDLANEIEANLTNLLQLVKERYRGIMSRPSVKAMIDTIANTEAALGPDMNTFNNAVHEYNAYAQRFPNNIVATLLLYPTKYSFFQPKR